LLPLLALPFYPDELVEALYIAAPAAFAMLIGFVLHMLHRKNDSNISAKRGAVLVCILWFSAVLITAAPYIISGRLNFTQAFFEGMNGWSTTSMTVLEVETLPHVLLLCRSFTNFFGGVGLICVVLSALSEAYGLRLYNAEGHSDKILPNLAKSARMILSLFAIYFAVGTIAYIIAGMPVFEAINHCITALSTGGTSTSGRSILLFDSLAIEIITMVLMILGATNFLIHMMLIKRKFRQFIKTGEVRCFAFLLVCGTVLMSLSFMNTIYDSAGESFRMGLFNTVSIITTTGLTTLPQYETLPFFSVALIIFFMLIGGSAGSTAGGIKIGRLYLIYKSLIWRIKRQFMSERNTKELSIYYPQGKVYIKEEHCFEAYNYVFLYITVLFIGVLVLTAHGYSFQDSIYDFAAVMGTIGLSSGIVSLETPKAVLWTMSAGMFLGRLEIIVIFLAFIQMFKDAGSLIFHKR
jgi:trk system potassium uptake protein TrkH